MSVHHFVSHVSQIEVYNAEGGYLGRRLVHFGGGGTGGGQICGYAHAAELYLPPGKRLISHWHHDREAIFYCLSGEGVFFLDGVERPVGPGDGMFMPLGALHGALNTGGSDLRFLDCALFTDRRSPVGVGEGCFANIERVESASERGAVTQALFRPETFGNPRVRWWGEVWLEPGQAMSAGRYEREEQILYVLEGRGVLRLWDQDVALRPGSIAYIIAGATHALTNVGNVRLRLAGSRSEIGRVPTPPYYQELAH